MWEMIITLRYYDRQKEFKNIYYYLLDNYIRNEYNATSIVDKDIYHISLEYNYISLLLFYRLHLMHWMFN